MRQWFFGLLILPLLLAFSPLALVSAEAQVTDIFVAVPAPKADRTNNNSNNNKPNRPGRPDGSSKPGSGGYKPGKPGTGSGSGYNPNRPGSGYNPNRPGSGYYSNRPGYRPDYRPGYYYRPNCYPYCNGAVYHDYYEEEKEPVAAAPAPAVPEKGFGPGGFEYFQDPRLQPSESFYVPPEITAPQTDIERYQQMMRTWQ